MHRIERVHGHLGGPFQHLRRRDGFHAGSEHQGGGIRYGDGGVNR